MVPPWVAPFMLHSLNTPRFDGTNIVKTLNNLENIARQFTYPDDQILELFKQRCTTPALASTVENITAGQYAWRDQKEELLAYYKANDQTCRADPTEVIEDIIRHNPLDDLETWKRKIADYNQVLDDAGDYSALMTWPFYKTLPWMRCGRLALTSGHNYLPGIHQRLQYPPTSPYP
jgi:hypothetical protein